MSAKNFCTLKSNIERNFDILTKKYKISEKDKCIFMNLFNSNIPMRKKTILTYEQKCKARKQDGQQCSRRHKPNELFCGKHIRNQKYGIYQLKGTSTQKNRDITQTVDTSVISTDIDVKSKTSKTSKSKSKLEKTIKSTNLTKGKRGRKPNPKKEKVQEFLTLRSVQIQDKYYYIDKFNVLYNPEPINGQYEIIGKLKDLSDTEIYYTTSLS